jgi:hypothetical protein
VPKTPQKKDTGLQPLPNLPCSKGSPQTLFSNLFSRTHYSAYESSILLSAFSSRSIANLNGLLAKHPKIHCSSQRGPSYNRGEPQMAHLQGGTRMTENFSENQTALTPGLTQLERVSNTFPAPSKTFTDIAAGNKSWWLPFLIMIVFGYLFFGAIQMKIGWNQVAENTIHMNAKTEEKLAQAPPETREQALKMTQYSIEGTILASPVVVLLSGAIVALVLWGTINFVFGGKATFPGVFSVWMFASLPGVIKSILGSIVAFFTAPESFNIQNFAPTSIGAFLSPTDTNAALYKLASALDVTTIWSMALLGIGVAAVARLKRSSGYIAVFGWWGLLTLIGVGWTAIFG